MVYIPDSGLGICPVVLVGEEDGLAVVWKIINGIVLERVVDFNNLIAVENDLWETMLQVW